MPTFEFTVDGEPHTTSEHRLTPTQILTIAKLDPTTHYLVLLQGDHQVSYKGKPDEPIQMHNHMAFIGNFCGPTPVS